MASPFSVLRRRLERQPGGERALERARAQLAAERLAAHVLYPRPPLEGRATTTRPPRHA